MPLETDDAKDLDQEGRDNVVGKVYRRLMEIESRLLPCGLHTIGVPPSAEEAIATLVNIAGIDRPEDNIKVCYLDLSEPNPDYLYCIRIVFLFSLFILIMTSSSFFF